MHRQHDGGVLRRIELRPIDQHRRGGLNHRHLSLPMQQHKEIQRGQRGRGQPRLLLHVRSEENILLRLHAQRARKHAPVPPHRPAHKPRGTEGKRAEAAQVHSLHRIQTEKHRIDVVRHRKRAAKHHAIEQTGSLFPRFRRAEIRFRRRRRRIR